MMFRTILMWIKGTEGKTEPGVFKALRRLGQLMLTYGGVVLPEVGNEGPSRMMGLNVPFISLDGSYMDM